MRNEVTELRERKLEASEAKSKFEKLETLTGLMEKRLAYDEHEMHEFGQFIVRYLPLRFHNTISEILSKCLDSKGIERIRDLTNQKEEEFKFLKNPKFDLINDISDQKRQLLAKFKELQGDIIPNCMGLAKQFEKSEESKRIKKEK